MAKTIFKLAGPTGGTFAVVDNAGACSLQVNGTSVAVGAQQATIADASVAHALNSTFSDTEVETALDALGGKINAILAALEAYGVTASA